MVRGGGGSGGASIAGDSKKMVADVDDVVHLVYVRLAAPLQTRSLLLLTVNWPADASG